MGIHAIASLLARIHLRLAANLLVPMDKKPAMSSTVTVACPKTTPVYLNGHKSQKPAMQVVAIMIPEGYHLYANSVTEPYVPTVLRTGKSSDFNIGEIAYTAAAVGELGRDKVPVYEGAVFISIPVTATPGVTAGTKDLSIIVQYQLCNDVLSLLSSIQHITLKIEVRDNRSMVVKRILKRQS